MDSWFREIHVPRVWCVYLVTGFNFREKIVLVLGQSDPTLLQPPTLPLDYEGKVKKTIIIPQNYVYALRTTITRHMLRFIDFYFYFLANFQT